jgi:toxin ParE1/3/4
MPTVVRTPAAIEDLKEIVGYIAFDNVAAAAKWLDEMEALFALLATQPLMGTELQSRRHGPIRQHAHGQYVVYFRGAGEGVEIVRVLHGARDHRSLI